MGTMIAFPEHDLTAYRADPPGEVRGAVIVIQEIWGLVDHIKDVADRVAAEGYIAIAPDLLGHIGLAPDVGQELQSLLFSGDEQVRAAAQPRMREATGPARVPEFAAWAIPALRAVVDLLDEAPGVDGDIAVMGFCFGGSYSFGLALAEPRLKGAVVFYGGFPETGHPRTIGCPILAFYGEKDHGITDGVPDLESRMAEAGVDFTARVYHGVGHAFFNDTNARTYNAEVAADAWTRTLEFLEHRFAD
ncbi:carboxymethylenebutenolidase [Intrasporangium oryzae NRRL B-24470]|uniref:Carboxymethylenebutenolidase n=1 Tax=Intrasporangium oryzae NRRL B-24470 TaxID=1386089 RepID=W9G7I2_9MICO|nr:dienelactone hydrolase family protein [Intrasporangium oryzae]EWT01237.1 carboxymethylenebutenolidase [Intrasporangium oryzae NRRL B-24470]